MTFKKPSRNSSSGDESPNDDDKADGSPPDDTRGERPTAENAENRCFTHLEALLDEERKKREKASCLHTRILNLIRLLLWMVLVWTYNKF